MAGDLGVLLPGVLLIAVLYSSVGHGGASGYLALLVLAGFARSEVTPVVLILNVMVAATSFFNYWKAGNFAPRLLLPFAVTAIPAAFAGGLITVSDRLYAGLLGGTLVVAALRFLLLARVVSPTFVAGASPRCSLALPVGGVLGFLSGMVGVGGGIFLSPLLLLLGWADAKKTAAVSSAFIVLNSLSGLAAHLFRGAPVDGHLLVPLAACVLLGGAIGSSMGARRLSLLSLQRLLGTVLMVAGLKLVGLFW
jgi:uncharacterized membrane protein YfcA